MSFAERYIQVVRAHYQGDEDLADEVPEGDLPPEDDDEDEDLDVDDEDEEDNG